MPRKEGEWEEYRHERVTHSTVVAGSIVRVEGGLITAVTSWGIMDDDFMHELKFGSCHYDDLERVKKLATYAAHMLRLLRAADDGDQEAVDKLEQIVAEGSKSELSE
jgi:hypothetical protein